MPRARSVFRPNASRWSTNWAIFPGKMSVKNSAASHPQNTRRFTQKAIAMPSIISTTPESTTVRSLLKGNQSGTCAWKAFRAIVRWAVPANESIIPRTTRAAFCMRLVGLPGSFELFIIKKLFCSKAVQKPANKKNCFFIFPSAGTFLCFI